VNQDGGITPGKSIDLFEEAPEESRRANQVQVRNEVDRRGREIACSHSGVRFVSSGLTGLVLT
jgi:hypothetical protein